MEEYLDASYEPECEFVDGVLVDRNARELNHSEMLTALIAYTDVRRREWNLSVLPILRVRVSPTRIRVPDPCASYRVAAR